MQGTRRTSATELYSVQELQAPSGTIVREFISPSGVVFAVAWRGPRLPDLRQTLGSYFEPYQSALRAKHVGHAHGVVELPDLIVHSGGHQRAFIGQAYLPALLPPGVALGDLR